MAATETRPEHMKRTALNDRARETVKRIAKKLEAWESNGEDMQVMEPEQSHTLDAHLAELVDRCGIKGRTRYSFVRFRKERYIKIDEGSVVLILLSTPEGTKAEISDEPFGFGEMVQVSEGVRISGPSVFLRLV